MEQNKSYLGYKPKDNNLVKLTQYLRAKNGDKTVKNAEVTKSISLSQNKILKNKRF